MDRDQLGQRLLATFLEELQEHVQTLNRDLLALKRAAPADRAEKLKQLFRAAHSLKGAARSVGARVIEDACHHLEEVLAAEGSGATAPGPSFYTLLFSAVDAIEAWTKAAGSLPINVKFVIEGEEEVGSNNLDKFLEANKSRLAADVAVISDTSQFAPDLVMTSSFGAESKRTVICVPPLKSTLSGR